ncbi:MAG: hypothetical protein HN877_11275 [Rhodospirillaceae bacterium]|nr:hypothetical protein [Rhodospirillaceae bacterium]
MLYSIGGRSGHNVGDSPPITIETPCSNDILLHGFANFLAANCFYRPSDSRALSTIDRRPHVNHANNLIARLSGIICDRQVLAPQSLAKRSNQRAVAITRRAAYGRIRKLGRPQTTGVSLGDAATPAAEFGVAGRVSGGGASVARFPMDSSFCS